MPKKIFKYNPQGIKMWEYL